MLQHKNYSSMHMRGFQARMHNEPRPHETVEDKKIEEDLRDPHVEYSTWVNGTNESCNRRPQRNGTPTLPYDNKYSSSSKSDEFGVKLDFTKAQVKVVLKPTDPYQEFVDSIRRQ